MNLPARLLGVGAIMCASTSIVAFAQRDVDQAAVIRQLAARPEIRQTLERARALEADAESDLIELTEVPAPPFEESVRALRFAEMLKATGLPEVSIDEVGNVLARRTGSGSGETVAIVAHLDTVFPAGTDVTVRRRGDRL